MNSLTLLRKSGMKAHMKGVARYGKPLNRWKWVKQYNNIVLCQRRWSI